MLSPRSFTEIKDKIGKNEEKISLLETINTILKERHEIESNYKTLSLKFTKIQKEETERRQAYDQTRKHDLLELENKGSELCKEHKRLVHQIEHLQWHLEGCSKHHKPCGGSMGGSGAIGASQTHLHAEKKPSTSTTISCQSSERASVCRPSYMANMRNSAERLIKSIIDLRKKIYTVEQRLEHEIKRKREMEKKLSDMRKDISRQKKMLTMRRTTPVPSSLPPIKNKCLVK